MIRVHKGAAPEPLTTRGPAATQRLCDAVARGEARLSFDGGLYGDPTVKAALIAAQHGKCCFCESKIGVEGDVEHFRPKAGYRQSKGARLIRPGYYWLAYDWDNLLLCCSHCNQREKRNLFPIASDGVRAAQPGDVLDAEKAVFVHPGLEEPQAHIGYVGPDPVWKTQRGKATIKALGLDRIDRGLYERRMEHEKTVRMLLALRDQHTATGVHASIVQEIDEWLRQRQEAAAEFSAMTRAAVAAWEAKARFG